MNEPMFNNAYGTQSTLFDLLEQHFHNIELCQELMYAQIGQYLVYSLYIRIK